MIESSGQLAGRFFGGNRSSLPCFPTGRANQDLQVDLAGSGRAIAEHGGNPRQNEGHSIVRLSVAGRLGSI